MLWEAASAALLPSKASAALASLAGSPNASASVDKPEWPLPSSGGGRRAASSSACAAASADSCRLASASNAFSALPFSRPCRGGTSRH